MTPLAPVIAAAATALATAVLGQPRLRATALSLGLAAAGLLGAAAAHGLPGAAAICLHGYSVAVLAAALLGPTYAALDKYSAPLAAAAAMGGFTALGGGGLVGAALGLEASAAAAAALLARRSRGLNAALRYYFSAALAGPLLFLAAGLAYMAAGSASFEALSGLASVAAVGFAVAGLGVEAGLAPFHAWVPLVFEEADWAALAVLLLLVDTPAELLLVRLAAATPTAWPLLLVLGSLGVVLAGVAGLSGASTGRLIGYLAVADTGLAAVAATAASLSGSVGAPVLFVVSGRLLVAGLAAAHGLEAGWGLLTAAYAFMALGAPPGPELPAKLSVLRSLYSSSPLLAAWAAVLMMLPAAFLVPAALQRTGPRSSVEAVKLASYTVFIVILFAFPWIVTGTPP